MRKDLEGYPEEGFQTENALTREEAMRAMTIWAARSAFEEDEKGSLESGKMADFIVTDKDLLTIPPEQIPKTGISQTWLAGEKGSSSEGLLMMRGWQIISIRDSYRLKPVKFLMRSW